MLFDDRLATVLRSGAAGDRARRTMYLQLLDLLGTLPEEADSPTIDAAFERFDELAEAIPAHERTLMVREPGVRLSNARLLQKLAGQEPVVAVAAMERARLPDEVWLALIPQLPVRARGFLRNRRDLTDDVTRLLGNLGVRDLVLTAPDAVPLERKASSAEADLILELDQEAEPAPSPDTQPIEAPVHAQGDDREAIGDIVRRIEEFRRTRESTSQTPKTGRGRNDSPTLPLHGGADANRITTSAAFDFMTDSSGRIIWADPAMAPMAVGVTLSAQGAVSPVTLDDVSRGALLAKQPISAGQLTIAGAPAISGQWRIDATPTFRFSDGVFEGYSGRLRREAGTASAKAHLSDASDRIRQMLHELRTPVNAIQGFSEVIQQQIFGPAPHEYRALAAAIAGDAARILAGFDELDRLARLETGTLELDEGHCDFARVIRTTVDRITPLLTSRNSAITVKSADEPWLVPMYGGDAERLAWRILASLATAITAGEERAIRCKIGDGSVTFTFDLPAALADSEDLFSASPRAPSSQALSAGLFGTGFALRLARAEAQAISGDLVHCGDALQLSLPYLTAGQSGHSDRDVATSKTDPAGIGAKAQGHSNGDNARDNGSSG
ncbi:MAG: histidine kinase dimerization/phospho-acceptor domain-containing protein [Caenibius sp.]